MEERRMKQLADEEAELRKIEAERLRVSVKFELGHCPPQPSPRKQFLHGV